MSDTVTRRGRLLQHHLECPFCMKVQTPERTDEDGGYRCRCGAEASIYWRRSVPSSEREAREPEKVAA